MPIKINKYSRKDIESLGVTDENVGELTNEYFICINATGDIHSIPHFKKCHPNVLNIAFDDTDIDKLKSCPSENGPVYYIAKACTEDLAIVLKKFIDIIPENAITHIYCTKGKSRSAAVANFISVYRNNQDKLFDEFNKYVYDLLMKVKHA